MQNVVLSRKYDRKGGNLLKTWAKSKIDNIHFQKISLEFVLISFYSMITEKSVATNQKMHINLNFSYLTLYS